MTTHTFLVAFEVRGDVSRESAEYALRSKLPRPGAPLARFVPPAADGGDVQTTELNCWWVAEDDRTDGSDNDSAVFVNYGSQRHAWEVLVKTPDPEPDHAGWSLTGECNNPERRSQ